MRILPSALCAALVAQLASGSAGPALDAVPSPRVCPSPALHDRGAEQPRVVHVRIYNQSRMSAPDVDQLLDVAAAIWAPNGIALERGADPDAVTVVLADRPTRATANGGGAVLGTTLFTEGHATRLINLSVAAAETAADNANQPGLPFNARPSAQRNAMLVRMLGVALAHEMAHYLLDTTQHSRDGLLRAGLGVPDLIHPNVAHLALTPDQQRHLCNVRESPQRP